jgi:6-phosphogluconolactonase
MKPEFNHYPDLDALSRAAAELLCTLAEEAVQQRGLFTVVLAGGKTPKRLYENLTGPPCDVRMPWPQIHLFWGDERCVPADHPDSNFGLAFRAMISRVPVPPENVHRIPGEIAPPESAAQAYEKILRGFFKPGITRHGSHPSRFGGDRVPRFDLVLLGVGKDGHTASLFPGNPVLEEKDRWVAVVESPQGSPPVPRITLTLAVINRARCILFMVSGAEKRNVVHAILHTPEVAARLYPAARVRPEGRLVWFLDNAAAP